MIYVFSINLVHNFPTFVGGAPIVAFANPCAVAAVEVQGVVVGEDHVVALVGQHFDG